MRVRVRRRVRARVRVRGRGRVRVSGRVRVRGRVGVRVRAADLGLDGLEGELGAAISADEPRGGIVANPPHYLT